MTPGSKNTYAENVYAMLKRQGWQDRFEHPGIYQICIDGQPVYIGKSKNMLRRLSEHWVGLRTQNEHKYRILAEAKEKKHKVSFDALYYAEETSPDLIEEEIGEKEGEYIRAEYPVLNTQIPQADNWRSFKTNPLATKITLSEILERQNH